MYNCCLMCCGFELLDCADLCLSIVETIAIHTADFSARNPHEIHASLNSASILRRFHTNFSARKTYGFQCRISVISVLKSAVWMAPEGHTQDALRLWATMAAGVCRRNGDVISKLVAPACGWVWPSPATHLECVALGWVHTAVFDAELDAVFALFFHAEILCTDFRVQFHAEYC